MRLIAQTQAPQLPPLPEGPSLDRVRGAIENSTGNSTWQVTLIALVLIIALLCWYQLRNRRQKKAPAAHHIALTQLESAASAEDDEHFAISSSNALRRYFENGLGIQTSARTSEEFLRSLKGNTELSASFQEKLAELFQQFDQTKFAAGTLSQSQRTQITNTAKELISLAQEAQLKEGVQS